MDTSAGVQSLQVCCPAAWSASAVKTGRGMRYPSITTHKGTVKLQKTPSQVDLVFSFGKVLARYDRFWVLGSTRKCYIGNGNVTQTNMAITLVNMYALAGRR
jgi:hypothetical protein